MYACLCGKDEIALCEVDEFCILDERSIRFQMKRDFKSMKLDAHYNVVHKPPRIILGERYVEILQLLKDRRRPNGKNLHCLFLKPLPSAKMST